MRLLLLAAFLAACSKKAPPPAPAPMVAAPVPNPEVPLPDGTTAQPETQAAPPTLQAGVRDARTAEFCGNMIPEEWASSLPVPALSKGKLLYRIFFYGRDGDDDSGYVYHRAEGDAALDEAGSVLSCSARGKFPVSLPKVKPRLTPEELSRREDELYPQLQDAAKLYASGRALTPDEKKRVAAAAGAFNALIPNGRAAEYQALSPEFWAWVGKNGGKTPGK